MSLARLALARPYTVAATLILLCILGFGAISRMPMDIFPSIDIPVASVVWTYNGMSAQEMQDRILIKHERQMASLVDDIARIEANSYSGVGVIKVFLHEGADVSRAISQLSSCALTVLKSMPRNITPPLILRYGATDVPVIQLSLSSRFLPDQRLTDLGQQVLRPNLAVVHGAQVPYPFGGKPRLIMVDLDPDALQARGLTPSEVAEALQLQNVIVPAGDVKIGKKDYAVSVNNTPDAIDAINDFPIKQVDGKTVFVRDVAHVHDGSQVQTNSVSQNGVPGALMLVRKTGASSTLAVIDGVKKVLPDLQRLMPEGVSIKAIFDQSIFVNASLNSVIMGGAMAAGLTALMILLFLGNWRLTLIILASIPLSIVIAILCLYIDGQTLNTMTLGGFALAVGILVDNSTVVIENIERHLGLGKPLERSILDGAAEVAVPTMLSTLAISVVFIPVFLLSGTAKYLFSPLSLSVILSLFVSLILSFTLVPVLFQLLIRENIHGAESIPAPSRNIFMRIHHGFEHGFNQFRERYRNVVAWAVSAPAITSLFFLLIMTSAVLPFRTLGMDFFPQIDAGQMRLHVRAPAGTRLEETQVQFAQVEKAIRDIVGGDEIGVMLDNIGLPYSGINIALSDSATVGPMDGEILISLKKKHRPTAAHMADLRRELPLHFPSMAFFFQPADVVNQVLNFGQPAPIDVQISGRDKDAAYALANKLQSELRRVPGLADVHVFQVPDAPALKIDVDRSKARELGLDQHDVANDLLVTLNSSAQVSPNFWLNPSNNVSYPLVVQTPTYRVNSTGDLWTVPLHGHGTAKQNVLMNVAAFGRGKIPMVLSQVNLRPVFDVHADVQGRDLASAANAIDGVIRKYAQDPSKGLSITLSGQVETMREGFAGLLGGMGLAVIFVFLLLVINFQSWSDPLIVLAAVPFALAGVVWMLFVSQTDISVPALMGTLMCIGLTTANGILVVTFANQRLALGADTTRAAIEAGYTRLRPVLMTAGAMIIGMIPMAFGVGEGGEQNAPLARAVIGGLICATAATLILVPVMYRLLKRKSAATARSEFIAATIETPDRSLGDDAFDAFDDDRQEEQDTSTYGHHAVSSSHAKGTGRRLAIFALLTFMCLGGAFFAVSQIKAREEFKLETQTKAQTARIPAVDVARAKQAPAGQPLVLPAETQAWYRSVIYARISGYLSKWDADIGDHVRKGQVLATIDTPDLDSDLEAARADFKAAESEVSVKIADADFAKTSNDRWHDSPKGVVSDQEREAKKAAYDSSLAQLEAARAKAAVAKAKLDGLLARSAFKAVVAPFDGVITERRIDPGDLVTAGSTASTTPLFVVEQIERLRVFVNVPQEASARLKVGSRAVITFGTGEAQHCEGTVARMTRSIDPRAKTMRFEIDVENVNLAPGMYVRASLELDQQPQVQVPASALIYRNGQPQVAVVENDVVNFRDVVILSDEGTLVGLSSGVKPGEIVVLNISNQISAGDKVAVNAPGTERG